MEEKIVFLTKEELKNMIDESPMETIPVTIVKQDGLDNGKFLKIGKDKCVLFASEDRSITCEFGRIFNNVALYTIRQTNINEIARSGTEIKTLLLCNQVLRE